MTALPPSRRVLKITAFNEHHLPLLEFGWGRSLRDPKFTEDLRVFCTDRAAFNWCKSSVAPPGQCVRTNETLGSADFGKGDYYKHTWLKWRLIQLSLQEEVEGVYWVDVDMDVLSDFEACADTSDVDFMYQQEWSAFNWSLNSGQMWLRRCEAIFNFISKVLTHASDTYHEHKPQMWAQLELQKLHGIRRRPLPMDRFQSHCLGTTVTSRACTYHACCSVTVTDKLDVMRAAREKYEEAVLAE